MAQFDKNSSEYLDNGHYNINGREFMSIWTYKKSNNIEPNNNNINGAEGQELMANGVEHYSSTPDFGGFSIIYIYPVEELENYY